MSEKIIIGRKDIADFPGLDLFTIEVKIDSGAYTSSFHCHNIIKDKKGEKEVIRCNFLDPGHPKYHEKEFEFENFSIRKVKSSNGIVEERFSIQTQIKIFDVERPIELTLTERSDMKNPVLLGRKFLKGKFVIDPSVKNFSARGIIKHIKI